MIERLELDLLKQRQRDLEVRLTALRQDIHRLEERLASQPEVVAPPALGPSAPVMSPVQIQPPPIPPQIPIVPQMVRAEVETPVEMPARSVATVQAPPVISSEPASRGVPEPMSLRETAAVAESRSESPQPVSTPPSTVF